MNTVVSLWRYPVKSMMGEELRATNINEKGILGDRAFALVDLETKKIVSAKNPRRWPDMFAFYSRYEDLSRSGDIRITLPDGSSVNSSDADVNAKLSAALNKDVKLISQVPDDPQLEEYWPDIEELDNRDVVTDEDMPKGTFFDLATVHLLTTSTLDELRRLYPQGRFESRRFRPNVILNADQPGFAENNWIGKTVSLGDSVTLKITGPCPRCVMTTLPQGDLPKDNKILIMAARHNNAHVGVYADVIKGGTVRCNDELRVLD